MKERIRQIAGQFIKQREQHLGDDDDLYAWGLKSLASARLMLALEQEFEIEFPESALVDGSLSTINRMTALVASLSGVSN